MNQSRTGGLLIDVMTNLRFFLRIRYATENTTMNKTQTTVAVTAIITEFSLDSESCRADVFVGEKLGATVSILNETLRRFRKLELENSISYCLKSEIIKLIPFLNKLQNEILCRLTSHCNKVE